MSDPRTYHPARSAMTTISRAHRLVQRLADREAAKAKRRPMDRAAASLAQALREAADLLADIPTESSLEWVADQQDPYRVMDGSLSVLQVAVEEIRMQKEHAA